MRKINLTTTQNVTIEYELATVLDRSFSTLIDVAIVYLSSLLLYLFLNSFIHDSSGKIYMYIVVPFSFLYHLLMEYYNNGQTLGKKILKIRVVKINGERPGIFDFIMRTTFRIVDISSTLGTLALFMASSTQKGQRLGDYFADTTVVKMINFDKFSLDIILSMDKLKAYTPQYPGIVYFKEEEMLLIKETMDRYIQFKNESHKKALALLIQKIEGQLGVVAPPNKLQFLNILIKDYVSLTR